MPTRLWAWVRSRSTTWSASPCRAPCPSTPCSTPASRTAYSPSSSRSTLGFACDTPRGLLVPVIRSAQALGLKAFSDEAKRLAGGAIDGTIAPDFLSGGTFTVSNIGSFGIETFTPVINLPQTAILGVGAITPRPVVAADGTISVEQRLNLSLTIDHQVIDGADGARFLRDLVAAIDNIDVTVLA